MRRAVSLLGLLFAALGCGAPQTEPTLKGDPVAEVRGEELFERGVRLARQGDLLRAEQYLAVSMQKGVSEERVLPVLLRVCLQSSRLRVALRYAEPYLERNPEAWTLRTLVATILLALGDADKAHAELEQVVEREPKAPDPHYLLAVVLRDQLGAAGPARAQFERYLELAPDGVHAPEARDALAKERPEAEGPRPLPVRLGFGGSAEDAASGTAAPDADQGADGEAR